jgi:alanine-glyoxylate transaminase/serine-glyoxylate transaminase/serine-pyruvate transaminase
MSSQDYAPKRKISSFYPPQRHLDGPRPVGNSSARVLGDGEADHRLPRPVFVEMMEELKESLRYAFQTHNALTFPISGPGSVGWKCASST